MTVRLLPHVLAGLTLCAFLAQGLGYRHLWIDEVDTAERARSVLTNGYPRVVEANGSFSLNTGGRELEDGDAHRYTPWVQFYVAAAGLAVARATGLSRDGGVRLPFVVLHAAQSVILGAGLELLCAVPAGAAVTLGLLYGVHSVRLVFNREARYPAVVDLWVVLGLLALALQRRGHGAGARVMGLAVVGMVHTQPMSAVPLCAAVGVLWITVEWERGAAWRDVANSITWSMGVPGFAAAALLLWQLRPWAQASWGNWGAAQWQGLNHSAVVLTGMFTGLGALLLLQAQRKVAAAGLLLSVAAAATCVFLMGMHPMSATRYYIPLVTLFLGWPLALGCAGSLPRPRRLALAIMALSMVAFDARVAVLGGGHLGVARVLSDRSNASLGTEQPLHRAVRLIRALAAPGDAVLFDAVPQYANWYLPGHPVALMPDPADRTALNQAHPLWARPRVFPDWHVWFPQWGTGAWTCHGHCDVEARWETAAWDGRYTLSSGSAGKSVLMCPVLSMPASRTNNAPYEYLATGELDPAGLATEPMVVARPCAQLEH